MDRIAGAKCGRLEGSWIMGAERKPFRTPFFPFFIFPLLNGMGVIFPITNRVNRQIRLHTKI